MDKKKEIDDLNEINIYDHQSLGSIEKLDEKTLSNLSCYFSKVVKEVEKSAMKIYEQMANDHIDIFEKMLKKRLKEIDDFENLLRTIKIDSKDCFLSLSISEKYLNKAKEIQKIANFSQKVVEMNDVINKNDKKLNELLSNLKEIYINKISHNEQN